MKNLVVMMITLVAMSLAGCATSGYYPVARPVAVPAPVAAPMVPMVVAPAPLAVSYTQVGHGRAVSVNLGGGYGQPYGYGDDWSRQMAYDQMNFQRQRAYDQANWQRQQQLDAQNFARQQMLDAQNLARQRALDAQSAARQRAFDAQQYQSQGFGHGARHHGR